jgi:hypothetical protein
LLRNSDDFCGEDGVALAQQMVESHSSQSAA